MIDVNNEVFTTVATAVRNSHAGVTVIGESTRKPPKFPTVTLDETENVTHLRVSHLTFDFCLRCEGCHRVDHDDVDCS